ncbi:MAG: hypothetical protein COA77_11185 [Thaumarchaeota archaeon]|nr:MAG: hypothetical protein COA77_11185 [Nitrososphaerota archaeon]
MENKIFDYPQICDKIKNLDEKIQFVSVINEKGNLVTGGVSDNSESSQNKRFYEDLYEEVATRVKLRKDFDMVLGKLKGSIIIRHRVVTMSIPIKNDILFVSADTSINYSVLLEKILKEILVQN